MSLSRQIAQRIADRIRDALDKPVSVTDTTGVVLASTRQRLHNTPIACAQEAIHAMTPCNEAGPGGTLLSLPLVYNDAPVGALVLHDLESIDPATARVVQTLAELIIHQMTVVEQLPRQQWILNKFVADLLHSRIHESPAVTLQEAAILAIDLYQPRVVALINIEPVVLHRLPQVQNDHLPTIAHALRLEHIHEHLLDQVKRLIHAHKNDVFSFIDDQRLIILAAIDETAPDKRRNQLVETIQSFLDVLAQQQIITSAGVGRYYPGWEALAQSFTDAQFAFETGRAIYGPGRVFCVEDLGLAGLLWSDDRSTKVGMAQRILRPLIDEPDLLHTLETFLHSDLSPAEASRALHIHRHTLAYRLDKITHLTGVDPRHFEGASMLAAALLLRQLNSTATAPGQMAQNPPSSATDLRKTGQ